MAPVFAVISAVLFISLSSVFVAYKSAKLVPLTTILFAVSVVGCSKSKAFANINKIDKLSC